MLILACVISIGLFQSLTVVAEDSLEVLLSNGDNALAKYQYRDALAFYQRASRVAPSDSDILIKVAKTYFLLGAMDYVKTTLDNALSVNPNNIDALIWQGQLAEQKADFVSAKLFYQRVINQQPNHPIAAKALAGLQDR